MSEKKQRLAARLAGTVRMTELKAVLRLSAIKPFVCPTAGTANTGSLMCVYVCAHIKSLSLYTLG